MKVLVTLHPSFIQRGAWNMLAHLRDDLEKANRESVDPRLQLLPTRYVLHPTPAEAREFLRLCDPRPLYLDIENDPNTGEIFMVGVGREPQVVCVLPWWQPFMGYLAAALQDPTSRKVAHNMTHDFPRLESALGIEVAGERWDTLRFHATIEPDLRHGLKKIGNTYYDGLPWKEDMGGNMELYNAKDVDVMARADVKMLDDAATFPRLRELYRKLVVPSVFVADDMKRHGVRIDTDRMRTLRAEMDTMAEEAQGVIRGLVARVPARQQRMEGLRRQAGLLELEAADVRRAREAIKKPWKRDVGKQYLTPAKKLRAQAEKLGAPDTGSTKQMAALLYEDLGLPQQTKSNKDRSSKSVTTDEDALVEVARRCKGLSTPEAALGLELIEQVLKYRKASKFGGTYLNYGDALVHADWMTHGAGTGRWSCARPNLQNIPSRDEEYANRIRSIFVPVNEGWMLTAADYSQIEMRIQALRSGCPVLAKGLVDGGDLHRETAAIALSVQRHCVVVPEEVTKHERYLFKRGNYLEAYGGTWKKLQTVLARDGVYLTVAEAKEVMALLKEARPVLNQWREFVLQKARAELHLVNAFGRMRWFLANAYGDALNFLPQSDAADVINTAAVRLSRRCHRYFEAMGWGDMLDPAWALPAPAIMVAQVHDELIVEHPPEMADEVSGHIQHVMELPVGARGWPVDGTMADWTCPVDVRQGINWCKED